jgi:esterase/lipase superfamily enzyme
MVKFIFHWLYQSNSTMQGRVAKTRDPKQDSRDKIVGEMSKTGQMGHVRYSRLARTSQQAQVSWDSQSGQVS